MSRTLPPGFGKPAIPLGTVRPHRRTGIYEVSVPSPGRKQAKWLSTGCRDRTEALAVIAAAGVERLTHLALAGALTEATIRTCTIGVRLTGDEAINGWADWLGLNSARNTVRQYRHVAKKLFTKLEIENKTIINVTERDIFEFVNHPDCGRSLRQTRLFALRSLFKWANAKGYVIGNPAALIEIDHRTMTVEQIETKHYQPFTEEEYEKLLAFDCLPQFWRDATVLAYCAGLRLSDCAMLEWASLTDEGLLIYPAKTRHKRLLLPLSEPLIFRAELNEAIARLRALPRAHETFVWPAQAAKYVTTQNSASDQFKKLLRKVGIEGKSFHSLRTAFARRLTAAGKTIEDVARAMGHESTATTEAYLAPQTK